MMFSSRLKRSLPLLISSFVILISSFSLGSDAPSLRPVEFPPPGVEYRVSGALVEVDYIHRRGVFRDNATGDLVNFGMAPFGAARYLNSQADLRDLPLGINLQFSLYQDAAGAGVKAGDISDDFTVMASQGETYRVDEFRADEGKLVVTKQRLAKNELDLGKSDFLVNAGTRVWKDGQRADLSALTAGASLLLDRGPQTADGWAPCADIWVGEDAQKRATAEQHARNLAFIKMRGLPAWVERVEDGKLTVTLFSSEDRSVVKELFNPEEFVTGKDIMIAVANQDLRPYDSDNQGIRTQLIKVDFAPTDRAGSSGIRLVLSPSAMLDGYRPGGILRIFAEKWSRGKWTGGALYGESLGHYRLMHSFEIMEPFAHQYPFRTDFGNEQLPWFQPKPGEAPPPNSEHRVTGELLSVNADQRGGQFRTDRTGEIVNFTLLPQGGIVQRTEFGRAASPARIKESPATVLYRNASAKLADLPIGTRCQFYLYQGENAELGEKEKFTRASLVMDMSTRSAINFVTWRIAEVLPGENKLRVVSHLPFARDYQSEPCIPLDLGRAELQLDPGARVWKNDQPIQITDLHPGDDLLFNTTGRTKASNGRCTEIWIGEDTQKMPGKTARQ